MTSSVTACGACGTLNRPIARHVSNGRHSASAGIADVCFELTMMKVSDMKLRAQAVALPKEGYSYSAIVWGSQEGNVLRANKMKLSPSVRMWGGMMGQRHGLTDLHFVMQEI